MIIRRNAKLLSEVFQEAKNIKVFALENYFIGKEVKIQGEYLADILNKFRFARLTREGNKYHLSIHSNLWYEFEN